MLRRCSMQLISRVIEPLILIPLIAIQVINTPVAHADYAVTVDPSQQYQIIQGWGTSLAWWANIIGGWSDSQRIPLAQALYSPTQGIGLNVVRYNFGADGPGNLCHNQMRPGGNVPSFESAGESYVWTNDANQLWFAKQAQLLGADTFQGFVNSAPAWMLNNSCTAGGPNGAENLNPAHYSDFANYIATIAKQFHDGFGITLQTVEPLNEPTGTSWTSTGNQEGMDVSPSTQNSIIPLLASALQQNGASAYTGIASPDDFQVNQSNSDYNSYSGGTQANIVEYNTHTYGGSDSDRLYAYNTIGQADNKRIWMSEWGIQAQGSPIAAALALSNEILDDEHNLHPTAWVAWQAINSSQDTPDTVWGLAYFDSNNTISYPSRYYAMGNYSKFIREGYQMIGNSDPSSLTAYNAGTQTLVIVTTNNSSSSTTVNYDLSRFTSVGGSVIPYQTTATENLQQLPVLGVVNQRFGATLPGQSITTFVVHNIGYSGVTTNAGSIRYTIINRNSGLPLDVNGAPTSPGASVVQESTNGGSSQQWRFVPTGDRFYSIVNQSSGLLLDVNQVSKGAGSPVIQWSTNGGANQQWSLAKTSDGYWNIINRNSNLLLDINQASTSPGASAIQWSSDGRNGGGTNQQWSLVPVSG